MQTYTPKYGDWGNYRQWIEALAGKPENLPHWERQLETILAFLKHARREILQTDPEESQAGPSTAPVLGFIHDGDFLSYSFTLLLQTLSEALHYTDEPIIWDGHAFATGLPSYLMATPLVNIAFDLRGEESDSPPTEAEAARRGFNRCMEKGPLSILQAPGETVVTPPLFRFVTMAKRDSPEHELLKSIANTPGEGHRLILLQAGAKSFADENFERMWEGSNQHLGYLYAVDHFDPSDDVVDAGGIPKPFHHPNVV